MEKDTRNPRRHPHGHRRHAERTKLPLRTMAKAITMANVRAKAMAKANATPAIANAIAIVSLVLSALVLVG